MSLVLNEEQQLLKRAAADFVASTDPLKRLRRLRDTKDALGFSRELFQRMAELGWTAIPFTEEDGGAGLGSSEIAVLLEELGRGLVPEPYLSSVVFGGGVLALAGSRAQKAALLGEVIAGSKLATVAFQERNSRYSLEHVATRAERSSRGHRLSGEKIQVPDGHAADVFIVSARTAGAERDRAGITLFIVERGASGVSIERQHRVDGRGAALVSFDGVEVSEDAVVGRVGEGFELLEQAVDRATVALSAEMLGGMSEAFQRTLLYLKSRLQFGVVIGTFQALKHRAARMYMELELTRSAVLAAARAVDASRPDSIGGRRPSGGLPDTKLAICTAKARASDTFMLIANEAIQMHGGIGMTDEHDIGFFLKRARAAEMTFGDSAFQRDRFARLSGY